MARSSAKAGRNAPGDPRATRPARRRTPSRRTYAHRRLIGLGAVAVLAAAAGPVLAGGGGTDPLTDPSGKGPPPRRTAMTADRTASPARAAAASASAAPPLVVRAPASPGPTWTTVAEVDGRPAAWLEVRSGVALMRFDQARVHVTLHAGWLDGGVSGWTYGDEITAREIHHLVAGFNGGFQLTYTNVGFESGGHVAVPLKAGLASVVTYTDATTNIGAWGYGVPSAGRHVYSVLQNQQLLVDRGRAASTVSSCIISCWGETIQGLTVVARSGLGIMADGRLVWAAGEQLTPATLAQALIGAGAVRAIELDINPDWVAGYLYTHHETGPTAVPVVPGQLGIPGQLLAPDKRDFLAIVAN